MVKMSTERSSRLLGGLSLGVLAVLIVSGCRSDDDNKSYPALQAQLPPEPAVDMQVPIGVEMSPDPPQVDPTYLASTREYGVRSNPFGLLRSEVLFDEEQRTEKFLADFGGWENFDVPPVERPEPPAVQPLPQWRLSGVIIGNGVLALLDTGSRVYEIRPGMTIEGWRVASIDDERAILVRDGNVLPKEFQVNLQGIIGGGPGRNNAGTGRGAPGAPGTGPGVGGASGAGGGAASAGID